MAWERRASERARARSLFGRDHAGPTFLAALAVTATLGACRQTVVLDPNDVPEGGGAGETSPVIDGGNGGMSGGHFDGGRLDVPNFCLGGQIQHIATTPRAPYIIVSVDRSSSMQAPFGMSTRLQVVQQQVRALISKYRLVKFGYEEFPSTMGMCGNGQGCCSGDVVLPTYNNYGKIDKAISACDNGNGGPACTQTPRPTADALSKCSDTYKNLFIPDDLGHRYVLLLTSSDPTCQGSDATVTPCSAAVTQVTKMSNNFINTAVFGVGDDAIGSSCLDQLAQYGGLYNAMSPLYHLVRTPTDLSSSLESVIETIAEEACKIDVRSPPVDSSQLKLLFDGVPVPSDPVDGWTFDMDTNLTLTVHGIYCRALIQDTRQAEVVSGCPTPHN
jgi:hypothetical protein